MAQRSEMFSLRNIFTMALLATILLGSYSYYNLKHKLNTHATLLHSLRNENDQQSIQMRASMKTRTTCMKDLKQMQENAHELRRRLSESETDMSKQKSDAQQKLHDLKKEMNNYKSQFEKLQTELMKLKDEDRINSARKREDQQESEKKIKMMKTEHDIALSTLKDQVENLKKQNEELKKAASASGKKPSIDDGSSELTKRKHIADEEHPRQMQPPDRSRRRPKGPLAAGTTNSTSSSVINVSTATSTSVKNITKKSTVSRLPATTKHSTSAMHGVPADGSAGGDTVQLKRGQDDDTPARAGVHQAEKGKAADSEKKDDSGKKSNDDSMGGKKSDDSSVGGKKSDDSSMGGKKSDDSSVGGKKPDDNSMGGKKSDDVSMGGKKSDDGSIGGKKSDDGSMGGKKSDDGSMGSKKSGDSSVVGKKSDDISMGGKKSDDSSMGGKKSEDRPVGGKRSDDDSMGGKKSDDISMSGKKEDSGKKAGDEVKKPDDSSIGGKKLGDEKLQQNSRMAAALDQMKRGRKMAEEARVARPVGADGAAGAGVVPPPGVQGQARPGHKEEKEEQQLAMPLPHHAAKRNKEPNQLPQPGRAAGSDLKADSSRRKLPMKMDDVEDALRQR